MKTTIFSMLMMVMILFAGISADAQGHGKKRGHYKHKHHKHYKHKHRHYDDRRYNDRYYEGAYYHGHRHPRPVIIKPRHPRHLPHPPVPPHPRHLPHPPVPPHPFR